MNFKEYISELTLDQLREFQNILSGAILHKQSFVSQPPLSTSAIEKRDVNDYVTYYDKFLDNTDIDALTSECLSLGFDRNARNDSVQNRFVSPSSEPYNWDSSGGPVVNNPVPLQDFPCIKRVMDQINSKFGFSLNCSLVSFYKNGKVRARLHSDDEDELDHTQPIVVVSLGAVRTIEFVDNNQSSFRHTAKSLGPSEGSVYVMHPGCQQGFRHRVRMSKKTKGYRISLSFRAFKLQSEHPKTLPIALTSSPNKSDASFASCNSNAEHHELSSQIADKTSPVIVKPLEELLDFGELPRVYKLRPAAVPPPEPINTTPPDKITLKHQQVSNDNISSIHSPVPPGYAPFPSHSEHTGVSTGRTMANEKICVLFGTSITDRIDGPLMSKKNRTVVNVSTSGANIDDIRLMAHDFHADYLRSIHKIDKIVVSVGTNDIKWYNSFARNMKRDMKPKLVLLVKELKLLFPSAQIYFHTVLPIRVVYKYTAASVHQFNNLLLEVCSQYRCFFFDCFSRFLDKQGNFYNKALFRDNFHLNDAGLKVLCRALKFMIYGDLFNPHPRYSCYPSYYPC
jgi:alkylated DNA repair dioxygenase AlkB/lysophospholipase L1-like esterase